MNGRKDSPMEAEALLRHLTQPADECELCHRPGGELLWQDALCRVVAVADADYPGFCRVILNHHAGEMSDLDEASQMALMRVVFAVETMLRTFYRPDKINLASLGNLVPHLHWHVIPRWRDDRHFPQPVWGIPQRPGGAARVLVPLRELADELQRRLG
jgi:diadenosine tetraphosphate (Ap4A) HIT family hydrolase